MKIKLKNISVEKIKVIKLLRTITDYNLADCKKISETNSSIIEAKKYYSFDELILLFRNLKIEIEILEETVAETYPEEIVQPQNFDKLQNFEVSILIASDRIKNIRILRSFTEFSITKCQELIDVLPSKFEIKKTIEDIEKFKTAAFNHSLIIVVKPTELEEIDINELFEIKKDTNKNNKNIYKVTITNIKDKKLNFIKILRQTTELSLLECKELSEKQTITFYLKSNSTENGDLAKQILNLGASINIEKFKNEIKNIRILNYSNKNKIEKSKLAEQKTSKKKQSPKTIDVNYKKPEQIEQKTIIKTIEINNKTLEKKQVEKSIQIPIKTEINNNNFSEIKTIKTENNKKPIKKANNSSIILIFSVLIFFSYLFVHNFAFLSLILTAIFISFYAKKHIEEIKKRYSAIIHLGIIFLLSYSFIILYYFFFIHLSIIRLFDVLINEYIYLSSLGLSFAICYFIISEKYKLVNNETKKETKSFYKNTNSNKILEKEEEYKNKKITNNNYKKF